MIAPVSPPRFAARMPVPKTEGNNAPIRVRRLDRGSIHLCQQKETGNGLYIGQTATLDVAGELQTFASGDLLILPQSIPIKASQVVDVWVLEFLWDALAPFSSGVGDVFPAWRQLAAMLDTPTGHPKRYAISKEERTTWQRCLQTLDQELQGKRLGYCESAKAQLTLLLVSLARNLEADLTSLPLTDDPTVTKVLAYIEVNFRRPLTLERIAAQVHRSPAYLTTRVREHIGQSVMDYVIERRMQEAEALLKTTDNPVSVIGEAVGYLEPSTFSRQFRKRHGLSPAAWREVS